MVTRIESAAGHDQDRARHAALLRSAREQTEAEQAWCYLQAAHIVGQQAFKPHLETHARMLALACRTRDWGEAAGQGLRLLLVPLGHLTGRLPLGNPGRATVSAVTPLPVPVALQTLIDAAGPACEQSGQTESGQIGPTP
ncbi:DUF3703 domain-containing protein [Hylemonella gracilis]|uniref:DUF3703 domain-containing protein n=1 Tax=Hylemonella gracilis TaxID=80880 RepID=A0A4P6UK55_9BURK|nr:DUF3703 domain-containing protein [Hylemonella gracilis]QBK05453.1 DUF3703 domain-containing protein [Hylemonella gracilis]